MRRLTIRGGCFPVLTSEQEAALERAKTKPFVYDEECPPQTNSELKLFRRVHKELKAG